MSISVNTVSVDASSTARTSFSFNHTVSGSERLLLVCLHAIRNGEPTITSVTYEGVALSLVKDEAYNYSEAAYIKTFVYKLANVAHVGVGSVVVTYAASVAGDVAVAYSLSGCADVGASASAQGNSNAPSTSLTTTRGGSRVLAVATFRGGDGDPFSEGGDLTDERWDTSTGTSETSDISVVGADMQAAAIQLVTGTFGAAASDFWTIVEVEATLLFSIVEDPGLQTVPAREKAPVILVPSGRVAPGLTLSIHEPSFTVGGAYTPQGVYEGRYGQEVSRWTHESDAVGGFWSADFSFPVQRNIAEEWLERGLLRDVVGYNHEGGVVWEGFVNEVEIKVGNVSMSRGPLLDIGNRVSVTYTPILDATVIPPLTGSTQPTTIASDTDSQAKYTIIEKILSAGTILDADAEQLRDTWLAENSWPVTSFDWTGGGGFVEVNLRCLGYVHWLTAYIYNQTATSATTTLLAKMQAIITADPNSIISTDYANMAANALLVPSYENESRFALDIIKPMIALGDVNDARFNFGVYENRLVHYGAIPTTIEYHRRLVDTKQRFFGPDSHTRVYPWDVRPGKWLLVTDLMPGRFDSATFREDPRKQFIESVSFTAPYDLNPTGARVTRFSQKVAKMGLGSM